MLRDETTAGTFSDFVEEHEARLRDALTARFGSDIGKDAAADALAYGWEHWERIQAMDNSIGYLYTVGRANPLRMVLLVGSNDQYSATNASITAAFAEALKTHGTDVEVVEVPDTNLEHVMRPDADAGQTTLQVISDILDDAP